MKYDGDSTAARGPTASAAGSEEASWNPPASTVTPVCRF